jgi:hypothetical protein
MLRFSKTNWLIGIERVLLTLWIGGLWVTGYLVVPILFALLDDRNTVGLLAGRIFQTMNYAGLGVGAFLLISVLMSTGESKFKEWRAWILVTMLLIITVAAFILQPMMHELKTQGLAEGSVQATLFGGLLGVSSVLFLIFSLLGLLLVAVGVRK